MGATMRITCLLFSLSLLCQKSHCESLTAATSVTVKKDASAQVPTALPTKVPTVASLTTIRAVEAPATDKVQTVAPTNGDAVKVTQATTGLPSVTIPPVVTAPTAKITPAPTQQHQPQTNSPRNVLVSTAPPTVKIITLAAVATTGPSKTTLVVPTTGSAKESTPSKTTDATVTLTAKASTGATTVIQKSAAQTTNVALKTTEQHIATVQTSATITQQMVTAGTTKLTGSEKITTGLSVLASLSPSTIATTTATPTVSSSQTTMKITITESYPKKFSYSLNNGQEKEEEKDLAEVCRRLMGNLKDGNCTLTWRHHKGKLIFDCVEINGKVKTALATQYYEEITKKPTDNKTLIAILASCGALLIMIIILAVCASHHRKPYSENQQHLTEELHTVENGYHDNPTLEVMEVQPEMQEKKLALNGEFNDGWIVPIDNLLKDDIPDEEDTHL
ncbi:podocalyxin [Corythoichthys intestinalis]|uniref:podocalyxin n=1 Tax=Corythoichthys intestinalis TaxID=161448 RepID=UPI0025A5A7A7|nr:podocalyxin [Corythoichthys intestinalis]